MLQPSREWSLRGKAARVAPTHTEVSGSETRRPALPVRTINGGESGARVRSRPPSIPGIREVADSFANSRADQKSATRCERRAASMQHHETHRDVTLEVGRISFQSGESVCVGGDLGKGTGSATDEANYGPT